jgi:hypothetical protein
MSTLADLEIALRQDCAYAKLAGSHAHRATREDSVSLIKGRDAITTAWVAEGKQTVVITADLGDMIAFEVDGTWKGHRWVWREDNRILREVIIEDRGVERNAPPVHPPIGELRAGKGQFAAGDEAILPASFPREAKALADKLHKAWNGRAFDLHPSGSVSELIRALPDATVQFEHALVDSDKIALLWRLFGHTQMGRRIRLIGSSLFSSDAEMTVFDQKAFDAQKAQDHISYAAEDVR